MPKVILDASALLALLRQEPGADAVEQHLPHFVMSSVNVAEVTAVLIRDGMNARTAEDSVLSLVAQIEPFDTLQAFASAALMPVAKPLGLSLGDRACLALGGALRFPVLTAEQIWQKLRLPVEIRLIR